jgi:hypothetical protein
MRANRRHPVSNLVGPGSASANRELDAAEDAAEHVLQRIMQQYFEPSLSVEELRALARSAHGDPLKAFGEACRAELKSMRAAV